MILVFERNSRLKLNNGYSMTSKSDIDLHFFDKVKYYAPREKMFELVAQNARIKKR